MNQLARNKFFWIRYFREAYLSEVDHFASCLTGKLLPAFDNLEQEAKRLGEEEFKRLCSLPARDDCDLADAAEKADETSANWYVIMTRMVQGIINLFTAGLYHIVEQQLLAFYRREFLPPRSTPSSNELKIERLKESLHASKIDVEKFHSWSKIYELKLVANTVKHAEGPSCQELKSIRPDLFQKSSSLAPHRFTAAPGPVFQPLIGEDLYITQQEFNKYISTVKEFWIELISAIESLS